MDLLLEWDPPENRVREWLQHIDDEFHSPKYIEARLTDTSVKHILENASSLKTVKDKSQVFSSSFSKITHSHNTCKFKRVREGLDKYFRCERLSSSSSSETSTSCRKLYTPIERIAIINYIVENDFFLQIKGNVIWQKMEDLKICSRTWQSMKSQFMKYILPSIDAFSLPDSIKKKFEEVINNTRRKERGYMQPHQRGWRSNCNYYTSLDDEIILKYILRKDRYKTTHGNRVWIMMSESNVLPNRSWQSLKSRFLGTILPHLSRYKLDEHQINKLILPSRKKKSLRKVVSKTLSDRIHYPKRNRCIKFYQETNTCNSFSPNSNTSVNLKNDVNNLKTRHELRKLCLMTGLTLASNLKLVEGNQVYEKPILSEKDKTENVIPRNYSNDINNATKEENGHHTCTLETSIPNIDSRNSSTSACVHKIDSCPNLGELLHEDLRFQACEKLDKRNREVNNDSEYCATIENNDIHESHEICQPMFNYSVSGIESTKVIKKKELVSIIQSTKSVVDESKSESGLESNLDDNFILRWDSEDSEN